MTLQHSCGKSNTIEAVSEGTIFDISIVILIEQQIFCIINYINKESLDDVSCSQEHASIYIEGTLLSQQCMSSSSFPNESEPSGQWLFLVPINGGR